MSECCCYGRCAWYRWDGAGRGGPLTRRVAALAVREVVGVAGALEFDEGGDRRHLVDSLSHASRTMLAGAGTWSRGAALELRYVTEPQASAGTRVRLFLTAKAVGTDAITSAGEAVAAVERACAALPNGFQCEPAGIGSTASRTP